MKTLPNNLTYQKRTPQFSDGNMPEGMLGEHRTAVGIWAKIKVVEGNLTYRILEPDIEEHVLDRSRDGVVAPQESHQVEVNGPVRFYIEFFQE